jgi:catechol 2,3-dioxygenase-like lactoylglutathione lyase family enzyme
MPVRIKAAIPVLFVADVTKSAAFFRDKLGFATDFLHGEPPFYAGVSRDGATLHLRFVHEPVISRELREEESLLAAFIVVANATGLFDEYTTKGASFREPLHQEAWGGPTFTVVDLDDNRICFSEA